MWVRVSVYKHGAAFSVVSSNAMCVYTISVCMHASMYVCWYVCM